jgi:hypothetical protein
MTTLGWLNHFQPGQSVVIRFTGYTFNVTASSPSTALQFEGFNIAGAWLLDDVSVNPRGVGVPDGGSTVCLLGFALLGLTALRRKLIC